jgi:trans-aconitate methyltransferase
MRLLKKALRYPVRAIRHLLKDANYQPYYSPESWERTWRDEAPDFTGANEDAHYGALLRMLKRHDRGELLDLGCGDGLLWEYYRPLSQSALTGIDYSESAVLKANARAISGCRFEWGDFRNWEPGRSFSVVVFNESVYYIDDIAGAVRRAESWLDPRGVLMFSMIDTLVTRRVWKSILRNRRTLQAARVKDLGTGRSRTIRVLAPLGRG